MDLLATVRKEGSRGGRGDFKWSDVQGSSHRENYLGHSLMAPVGRWQKGRDLNWYAKTDSEAVVGEDPKDKAARERAEEIRKVKEAEEDALARALGLPVAPRNNPNMEAIGNKREVTKILKESAGESDTVDGGKGVGFGMLSSGPKNSTKATSERIEGTAETQDKELEYALQEYRRRKGEHRRRSRSRSPDRDRKKHRRRHSRERDHRHRRRSRSRSRSNDRQHRKNPEHDSKQRDRRAADPGQRQERIRSPASRSDYRSRENRSFDRRERD